MNKYKKKNSSPPAIFIPEDTLDLHGFKPLSEFDIEQTLDHFLQEAYNHNQSKLLVITGKGINSVNGPVIKPLVQKYLSLHKLIKTYKQAGVENGGAGAFEIILED